MKTTIWYEMTDEQYVKVLRDAADALEKTGRVMLLLPNVELDDAPIAGGAGGINPYSGVGGTGGSPDLRGITGGGATGVGSSTWSGTIGVAGGMGGTGNSR